MDATVQDQPIYLSRLRAGLLFLYVMTAIGLIAELLITKHSKDFWQAVPIMLAGAGIVGIILSAIWASRVVFWIFQLILVLQIVSSVVGGFLHHKAREGFQIEAYPDLSGWELFKEAFAQRNPPPLRPGAMALTGLIGLAWSYRHPAIVGRRKPTPELDRSTVTRSS